MLEELCKKLWLNKILCSPYHPQTDVMLVRSNRTLCNDLASYVSVAEDDWDKNVATSCFRYHTTVHEATGMNSFKSMLEVDALELYHELGLRNRIYKDPGIGVTLARNLSELHQQLAVCKLHGRLSKRRNMSCRR